MVAIYSKIDGVNNGHILRHLHNALKRSLPMPRPGAGGRLETDWT